jgi:glutathione synthetase
MSRDILIIGDTWETLDHERDSSLHLCRIARNEFKFDTYWASPNFVFRENGTLKIALSGRLVDANTPYAELNASSEVRDLSSFHSVHWRADPPVDLSTMRLWSLLAATQKSDRVQLINSAESLLKWNEKFAPLAFESWAIPGLVANTKQAWEVFFEKHKGSKIIAKPSGEAASRGVQFLPDQWTQALSVLNSMQLQHGPWIVLQKFQPDIRTYGETRIFIIGGRVHAVLNKRPNPDHLIMNLDLPPEARPTLMLAEPTPIQLTRATTIAKTLLADGVYLATIDFIGDQILEINVTSPGLMAWVDERLPSNKRLAVEYWRGLTEN